MSQFPPQGQWPGQRPQQWGQPPMSQNRPQSGNPTGWPTGWPGGPTPRPQQWPGPGPGQWQWQQYQNAPQPSPQFRGSGQGFGPPHRPPKRSNAGLVIAVGVLGLAMVFGLFAWDRSQGTVAATARTITETTPRVSDLAPTPSEPGVTTDPPITTEPPITTPVTTTPPPSTAVGLGVLPQRSWDQLPGPHSSNEHWVTLQQNTLYATDIPAMTCPAIPNSFDSAATFKTFATATLDCHYAGWSRAFAAIGADLPVPKVTFIDGAVQSPCGKSGENVSFYCGTWDGSSYGIYVHTSLIEQSNEWWRLRAFETLAHEFGHHVQMVSGIMWAAQQITVAGGMQNPERSRRMELQTSCWAGRLLLQTPSTQFSERDLQTYIEWTERDQDEWHGSKASNQYWWQRGMYMTKVGGCNTFTVGPERVS